MARCRITVNGKVKDFYDDYGNYMTYTGLVWSAFKEDYYMTKKLYTVTYVNPGNEDGSPGAQGTLTPGMSIRVVDGAIYNVVYTGNA